MSNTRWELISVMKYSKVINDTLFNLLTFQKRISDFTFYDGKIEFDGCFEKW